MSKQIKGDRFESRLRTALLSHLEESGNDKPFFQEQICRYLEFYTNIKAIKVQLEENNANIDLIKEKRQITKEMRSILLFLGLEPNKNLGVEIEEL